MSPLLASIKEKLLDIKDSIDADRAKKKAEKEEVKAYEKEFETEERQKFLKEKAHRNVKKRYDRKMRNLK